MAIATRLKGFLDENRVPYLVLRHHRAYTAPEIAAALHVPGKELAKVVIVKTDDQNVMAVLPSHYRVNLNELSEATGAASTRLATEPEIQALFPDCEVGAMPPFGNLYNLPVYVDRSLAEDEEIVFEAGSHTEAIKLAYADFDRLVHPKVAQFGIAP